MVQESIKILFKPLSTYSKTDFLVERLIVFSDLTVHAANQGLPRHTHIAQGWAVQECTCTC